MSAFPGLFVQAVVEVSTGGCITAGVEDDVRGSI
jgi:hypothetical protein